MLLITLPTGLPKAAWRDAHSTWMRERRLAGIPTPSRPDAWGWT